jgi:hypothetical protein
MNSGHHNNNLIGHKYVMLTVSSFHSNFGWGGNTKTRWDDFVKSKQPKEIIV